MGVGAGAAPRAPPVPPPVRRVSRELGRGWSCGAQRGRRARHAVGLGVAGRSQEFKRAGGDAHDGDGEERGGFPPLVEAVVEEIAGFVYARVDPIRIDTHGVFYPKAYAFARRMEDEGHVFPAVKVRPSDPTAVTPLATPRLHARDGAHRVMAARLLHRTVLVRMRKGGGAAAAAAAARQQQQQP